MRGSQLRVAHRLFLVVLEGVGALAGLVLLAAVVVAIRIAAGPVQVDWLTPAVTEALNAAADPLRVTVDGTSLTWGAAHPSIDLIARNLRITEPAGRKVLELPSATISISLSALLTGAVKPTRVTLAAPRLRIVRSAAGEFGVDEERADSTPATGGEDLPSQPLPQMLRSLTGRPGANDPLGSLRQVSIIGASVTVEDRQSGTAWHVRNATATLSRSRNGAKARLAGLLELGAATARFEAGARAAFQASAVDFTATIGPLDPSAFASALPRSPELAAALQLPLQAAVSGTFDLQKVQPSRLAVRLTGGAGAIVDSRLSGGRLGIRSATIDAVYDAGSQRLEFRHINVDLGGPTLAASGAVQGLEPAAFLGAPSSRELPVSGSLLLRNLPLDSFAALWPPGVGSDARSWVTKNLSAGKVDALTLNASAALNPANPSPPTTLIFSGQIQVRDATVNYLTGLPKLEDVDSTIALAPDRMNFAITRGHLKRLQIRKASVVIDQFDAPVERMQVTVDLNGPAADVLTVLDAPRLQYAKAIGMEPDRVAGDVDGTLRFQFRLKKVLPLEEVEYGADARLSSFGLADAAFGKALTDGTLALKLDHDHVTLDGDARLDAIPLKLSWSQRIAGETGPRSLLHAQARVDQADRQRLGLDPLPDLVAGPVGADVVYRQTTEARGDATVNLDLNDADLKLELADWTKPPGSPGETSFVVQVNEGHVIGVDKLRMAAHGLAIDGSMALADGRITHAAIDRLTVGKTQATGTVDHPEGAPWRISLTGPTVDLSAARQKLMKNSEKPTGAGPALAIDLKSDRVIVGPDRELRQVDFRAAVENHALASGSLTSLLGEKGKLDFSLDPVASGGRFSLSTDDFGALFKLAGITENLVGGSLSITGTSRLEGDSRRFAGHAEGKDYRITHLPFMARLLSLASFKTIGSLMAGQGIPFTALKADFSLKQGRIDLKHARAFGGAIGVRADGWIDTHAGTLSLEGTLVPAYTLNSALGVVPILGNLIVGGEGGGIFGANVSVYGPLAEPNISINPLSALAPGFLRNLFLFDAPGPGIGPPPANPAPQPTGQ